MNDPTTYPPPSPSHGSYHWATERAISVALVPLFAAAAVKHGASGVLDGALALTLVVHSQMGFQQCLDDYVHKRKYPIAGPLATWGVRGLTLGAIYGLYGESRALLDCKLSLTRSSFVLLLQSSTRMTLVSSRYTSRLSTLLVLIR